jgi:CheY-like chemotaxis protein
MQHQISITAQADISLAADPSDVRSQNRELVVKLAIPNDRQSMSSETVRGALTYLLRQVGGTATASEDGASLLSVSLRIPLPATEDGSYAALQPTAAPTPAFITQHRANVRSLRILSVDDQRNNRMLLQSLLQHAGHRATMCSDPERALSYLTDEQFDVVLLDIHMPGVSGHDVYEQLRHLDASRGRLTPVVFITADSTPKTLEKATVASAAEIMIKPFDAEKLLASLAAIAANPPLEQS